MDRLTSEELEKITEEMDYKGHVLCSKITKQLLDTMRALQGLYDALKGEGWNWHVPELIAAREVLGIPQEYPNKDSSPKEEGYLAMCERVLSSQNSSYIRQMASHLK